MTKKEIIKNYRGVLSVILILLLFANCSVQKRRYTKGFYVGHRHAVKTNHVAAEEVKRPLHHIVATENVIAVERIKPAMNTFITANAGNNIIPVKAPKKILRDSCDVIVLANGTEIVCQVTETSLFEIEYKKCDLSGPTKTIYKKNISHIRYADGKRKYISGGSVETINGRGSQGLETTVEYKPMDGISVASFILSMAAGFIPVAYIYIVAAAFCITFFMALCGLIRTSEANAGYKGRTFAILGLIFSTVGIILSVMLMQALGG